MVSEATLNEAIDNLNKNIQNASVNLNKNIQNASFNLNQNIQNAVKNIGESNLNIINLNVDYKSEVNLLGRENTFRNVKITIKFTPYLIKENYILGYALSINDDYADPIYTGVSPTEPEKQLFQLYNLNNKINLIIVDIDDDTVQRLVWNTDKNLFEGTMEEVKEKSIEAFVGWVEMYPDL